MAQRVKDPALSLLWHEFGPWPEIFHMPWARPKTTKNPPPQTHVASLCPSLYIQHRFSLCKQHSWV